MWRIPIFKTYEILLKPMGIIFSNHFSKVILLSLRSTKKYHQKIFKYVVKKIFAKIEEKNFFNFDSEFHFIENFTCILQKKLTVDFKKKMQRMEEIMRKCNSSGVNIFVFHRLYCDRFTLRDNGIAHGNKSILHYCDKTQSSCLIFAIIF